MELPIGYRVYLVATPSVVDKLDLSPLGQRIEPPMRFDPMQTKSSGFLGNLSRLDELTYAPAGLQLPSWALYDCAEAVGAIIGLSVDPEEAEPRLQGLFGGNDAPLPVTMFIAVPTLDPMHYVVYTLCSVDEVRPGFVSPELRLMTAALGLSAIGARQVTSTTQWASTKLAAYARFAPLSVLAAWLPAHDLPATTAFRFGVDDDRIAAALSEGPALDADEWLDVSDEAALQALQLRLDEGERVSIIGPPRDGVIPIRLEDGP